jgi:hypothetical protein
MALSIETHASPRTAVYDAENASIGEDITHENYFLDYKFPLMLMGEVVAGCVHNI